MQIPNFTLIDNNYQPYQKTVIIWNLFKGISEAASRIIQYVSAHVQEAHTSLSVILKTVKLGAIQLSYRI